MCGRNALCTQIFQCFCKPCPNNCSHKRFTMVLAVSGFFYLVSHIARPSLFAAHLLAMDSENAAHPAVTSSPFTSQLPLSKTLVFRNISLGFSIIIGVVTTFSEFIKSQKYLYCAVIARFSLSGKFFSEIKPVELHPVVSGFLRFGLV